MRQLSLNEIDLIRLDISRQRVTYSHLMDDLIDHVCCDIEEEMTAGLDFKQAYRNVKRRIGLNRYKKIQEETIFLIDKNYRFMKTFMKIFGALSPSLLAVAALFKIQHWPGAGILLVLGFFFLCFFFLPSAVYVLYTENKSNKKHLFRQLSGLFSSVIFLLGILFKVQHWPGAGVMLGLGLLMIGLLFLPSLVISNISEDKGEGKRAAYLTGLFAGLFYIAGFLFKIMHWPGASILILIGLVLLVAIFVPLFSYANFKDDLHVRGKFIFFIVAVMMSVLSISLMSLSVSHDLFNEFVVAENQMDDVLNELKQENTKLFETVSSQVSINQTVSEIEKRTRDLENWIFDLKKNLILSADPENYVAISGNTIDCSRILRKDEANIPLDILIGAEHNGKAYELSDKLRAYKKYILSISGDPELTSMLGKLLDVSESSDLYETSVAWEQLYFSHRSLISCINSLTAVQIKLELTEKEILNEIYMGTNGVLQKRIAEDNS